MKIAGLAFLYSLGGYVVGVILGMLMVQLFSPPKSDTGMETAMTGFFVAGPLVAVLTFIGSVIYLLNRPAAS
jgi:hypothetical protein